MKDILEFWMILADNVLSQNIVFQTKPSLALSTNGYFVVVIHLIWQHKKSIRTPYNKNAWTPLIIFNKNNGNERPWSKSKTPKLIVQTRFKKNQSFIKINPNNLLIISNINKKLPHLHNYLKRKTHKKISNSRNNDRLPPKTTQDIVSNSQQVDRNIWTEKATPTTKQVHFALRNFITFAKEYKHYHRSW